MGAGGLACLPCSLHRFFKTQWVTDFRVSPRWAYSLGLHPTHIPELGFPLALSLRSAPSSPQYVVIPTRRSTAEAFQIVLSHLLGDAGSPYLIGLVSTTPRVGLGWGSGDTAFLAPAPGLSWGCLSRKG